MLEYPLNENLIWGKGEDVEWSIRIRRKYNFKMNQFSKVKLLKQKDKVFSSSTKEDELKLNSIQ